MKPIIKVHDVAFPRFQAPDLDQMETFLGKFGMRRSARTDTALYMRGTDPDHHVHVTHLGQPAFLGLVFQAVSQDDLSTLAQAAGKSVESLDEPGGGHVVRLQDPDGRRIDAVHGIENLPALDLRVHPPLNTGANRARVGKLQRVDPGPASSGAVVPMRSFANPMWLRGHAEAARSECGTGDSERSGPSWVPRFP